MRKKDIRYRNRKARHFKLSVEDLRKVRDYATTRKTLIRGKEKNSFKECYQNLEKAYFEFLKEKKGINYSQAKLEKAAGLSKSTLNKWFNGQSTKVDWKNLFIVTVILRASYDQAEELFKLSGNTFTKDNSEDFEFEKALLGDERFKEIDFNDLEDINQAYKEWNRALGEDDTKNYKDPKEPRTRSSKQEKSVEIQLEQ